MALATIGSLELAVLAMTLAAGLRIARRPFLDHYLNSVIASEYRATFMSTLSMMETATTAVLYPVIGIMSDVDYRLALLFLGFLTLGFCLRFGTKEEHLT